MTAREDQPQLGTCDFGPISQQRPHAKEKDCKNWRPEDQPRPTPPDPFKASRPDVTAPRKPGCYKNDAGTVIHRGTCSICNLQIPEEYQYDATEAQGEAPQCPHCHLPMSDGNGCHMSVETGAHPSQDAEQQLTEIAFYPRSANPADRQLVVYLGDAIDILARARSTPSLPTKEKEGL